MKRRILFCILSLCLAFAFTACKDTPAGGEEINKADYPFYTDSAQATYKFDFEEMTQPYFLGNVIYNETVLLTEENGKISGNLRYKPEKILSVRDYTWKTEYPASEYTVSGNTITAKQGTAMPYLTAENLQGKNIPEPYRKVTSITNVLTDYVLMGGTIYTESPLLYGNQISVSYVYNVKDLNKSEFPTYEKSGFSKLKAKLNAGEDVKLAAIGDSVAEGCSSSGHFNHEPFMDNWVTQVTNALNKKYDGSVTVKNEAVGGMASEWGAAPAQINKIVAAQPDMLMVHFGINDSGANVGALNYRDNMEAIIIGVQNRLPDCEIMLIKAFPAEPMSYADKTFKQYWAQLDSLANEYDGVYTLDMYTQGMSMLGVKKYMDVTGNGINHVNDYSSRLYTMNILSALIKY